MPNNSIRVKINQILEKAEGYSWVYYLIILIFLGSIRLEIVTGQENIIDAILIITSIALGSQTISKIKNRNQTKMPRLQCLKCGVEIDPVGEWTCKECGWKSTFPDN
ncbi:MAG: hypothetical protein IIA83_01795 [Thaumarchaeota archaeon]|nr:hypothetical protein [Nitrososphaerota archaeon]